MKGHFKVLKYDLVDMGASLRSKIKKGYIKKNVFYTPTELMLIVGYRNSHINDKLESDFCNLLNENEFYYDTKERKWITN